MTNDEILKEAKNYYKESKKILQELCDITKEQDEEFSEEDAFAQFDLILQSLLLNQAVADGNFCEAEKDFIMNLPDHNNLFQEIDSKEFSDLSWDKVFAMSNAQQGKLGMEINQMLDSYADDFVLPFAILDASTATNSLKDLSQNLSRLSFLLGSVDGNITEDEISVFSMYAEKLLIGKWAEVKELAGVMLDSDEEDGDDGDDDFDE